MGIEYRLLSKGILFDSGFDECSVCKQSMTMHYHIITFLSECQGVFQDFFLYFLNFPELSKSILFDKNFMLSFIVWNEIFKKSFDMVLTFCASKQGITKKFYYIIKGENAL